MQDDWVDKLNLLISNISPYYAFSVLVSVLAAAFSVWYTRRCEKEIADLKRNTTEMNRKQIESDSAHDSNSCSDEEQNASNDECDEEDDDDLLMEDLNLDESSGLDDLQARYKTAKHQAILEHLSSKMTPEQIVEEKNTEKAQLEAIFNLLKEQQDKFQVTDMKDLEDQLTLYR